MNKSKVHCVGGNGRPVCAPRAIGGQFREVVTREEWCETDTARRCRRCAGGVTDRVTRPAVSPSGPLLT